MLWRQDKEITKGHMGHSVIAETSGAEEETSVCKYMSEKDWRCNTLPCGLYLRLLSPVSMLLIYRRQKIPNLFSICSYSKKKKWHLVNVSAQSRLIDNKNTVSCRSTTASHLMLFSQGERTLQDVFPSSWHTQDYTHAPTKALYKQL